MRRYEVWPGGDGQSNKAENSGDGEMKRLRVRNGSYNSISNAAQYVTPVKFIAEKLKCACLVQEIGFSPSNWCS
jgi:hypothetical protein